MKLGIAKLALVAGTLVLLVGMIAFVAVAQELPPAPPGDAFDSGSSGGGGGGGGGGGYSPPAFQPYKLPLPNSNGTTIGSVEGKSDSDIALTADSNTTVDNLTYYVTYTAGLNYKPSNFWLDLNFETPSNKSIPVGMTGFKPLLDVNLTGHSLDIKSDSSKLVVTMPRAALGSTDLSTLYYVARYDGVYRIKSITPVEKDNETVSFDIKLGDTGLYTIAKTLPAATPTPTPTPTPIPVTPTPLPSPTSTPDTGLAGTSTYLALIGLVVGVIVGAVVVFFLKK